MADQLVLLQSVGVPANTNISFPTVEACNTWTTPSIVLPDTRPCGARSQVLANMYLLESIISMLKPDHRWPPELWRNNVLWVALACKQFLEPALRILWEWADSTQWHSLIKHLPSVSLDDGKFMPHSVLLEEHLDRFDLYTRFIKNAHLVAELCDRVSPNIISSITLYRQFKVFPILRTLTLDFAGKPIQNISSFFLFASTTLSEVTIKGVTISNEFLAASLLHLISTRSLLLDLRLNGAFTETTLTNVPGSFKYLRRLTIFDRTGHLPLDFFSKLAQLDHLDFLQMSFQTDIPETLAYGELMLADELMLSGPPNTIFRILNSITTPQLTSIELDFDSDISSIEDDTTAFRAAVVDREALMRSIIGRIACVAPELQILTVLFEHCDKYLRFPSLCIRQVLSCKRLTSITIPLDVFTVEVLAALRSAGEEWPAMKTIYLEGNLGTYGSQPLLLSQIEPFVALFPNLKTLYMPLSLRMDKKEIENMQSRCNTRSPCHKLQVLKFAAVTPEMVPLDTFENEQSAIEFGPLSKNISELLVVCQFIDHVFPHLQMLSAADLYYVDDNWRNGLEAGVKAIQKTRMSGTRCFCALGSFENPKETGVWLYDLGFW